MMVRRALAMAMAIAVTIGSAQAAETYVLDPAHSIVGFGVKHLVISTVRGTFDDVTATLTYDEQDVTKSSVEVTIKTASINTRNERRDGDLRSASYFEAEKYPDITFKSKKIVAANTGHVAVGDFTMHGVTKEISLPFTITGKIKDHRGNPRIGTESHLTIDRRDFGISASAVMEGGGLVVSNEVQIEISIEWVKQ
jgi:polyisoprenoid-binding protein YceI